MATKSSRPLVLACIGGVIFVGGVVAFIVASVTSTSDPSETSPPATAAPTFDPESFDDDQLAVVYPQMIEIGAVPEPITTDPEEYIRAAVAANGTWDTTNTFSGDDAEPASASWQMWKESLVSWQNVYPAYPEKLDLPDSGSLSFREEDQEVEGFTNPDQKDIIGEDADWDMLRDRDGRALVEITSMTDLAYSQYNVNPEDLGELDTTVEFTQWLTWDDGTGTGEEITITKYGTADVRVNCTFTVPAPKSAQQPGDCKLQSLVVTEYG